MKQRRTKRGIAAAPKAIKRFVLQSKKRPRRTRIEVKYADLSQYEDEVDKTFLQEVGIRAAVNAINENRALGIPVTFWQNGRVVRRMPNGQITIVYQQDSLERQQVIISELKGKKGTVIHAGKI